MPIYNHGSAVPRAKGAATTMIDSGAQRNRATDASGDAVNQRETTPRLMVGSWAGEVAVVEARTGRVCWLRRTRSHLGTFALDGQATYLAPDGALAVENRLQAIRDNFEKFQRLAAHPDVPTQLEARRASDGVLLWTRVHPKIKGQLHLEAEDGVVVASTPRHFAADVPPIQVLEGITGKLLWQVEGKNAHWSSDCLVAVRGGRIFARLGDHLDEDVTALDLRTGQPLWQRAWHTQWIFSPNGALIGEQRTYYEYHDHSGVIALIDTRDGTEVSSFPTDGVIRHLTDDGVAYIDGNTYEDATWIAAVNARTGEELWRTSDVPHYQLAFDGAILSYRRGIPEKGNVEIGALDATTGERLWQWRSPGSLSELLRLWGAQRIPMMLWDSTEKSVATIREIVWQPWFHLRRPPSRYRVPPRQQTLTARLHDIRRELAMNIGWPLWHELQWGPWRRPWQSHGAMNADWLAVRWGIVFLGTWLGLFALDAASGRLLWHALPTIDLSYIDPAFAP